ncbi:MAG: hypothetical protein GF421_11805 [Candidatus Aminicenantes bacterium]|nr:hypothetical protein [Candidatus Aminicenantes bacterium]
MKFLKVLINSLISGLFFCTLLGLLTFNLNTNIAFKASSLIPFLFFLFLTYGIIMTLIIMLFFFILQFFAGKTIHISWVSPLFLLMSTVTLTFLCLILSRANYRLFKSLLSPEISKLIHNQMLVLLFAGIIGMVSVLLFIIYKKNCFFFAVYFTLLLIGLGYCFFLRHSYPMPEGIKKIAELDARSLNKKLTVIGMEGLSFDIIIPLVNDQKLPNFSWLMEEGSWGKLDNFTPNELIILNRSFNTGKLPYKHGQVSKEKCLIFAINMEIDVIPRFIFFKQMERIQLIKCFSYQTQKKTKDIWEILKSNSTPYLKKDQNDIRSKASLNQLSSGTKILLNRFFKDIDLDSDEILQTAKRAFVSDAEFFESTENELEKTEPDVVYLLLRGLNQVEKYFYKYSFPEIFEEVSQEEINRYGSIIERYYQFYDEIIGRYLAAKKDNELLVVYSPHGMDYLPHWKRMVELVLGNPKISAYHENAPQGVVFFYGKGIASGKNIENMKIIDMTPTFLHYLGLPLGKDMDGIVNSSIFKSSFNMENPVLYISSYEEVDIKNPQ